MPRRQNLAGLCLAALLMTAMGQSAVQAQTIDPHRVYEERCARCHSAHAGNFAWESLRRDDGRIVGQRSGRPLQPFLAAGHGRLQAAEIEVLMEQLTLILERDALYRHKCRSCHDRSVELARLELIVKEGVLTGRYTDRNIEGFLGYHGRLTEEEVPTMVDVLTRHLTKAGP